MTSLSEKWSPETWNVYAASIVRATWDKWNYDKPSGMDLRDEGDSFRSAWFFRPKGEVVTKKPSKIPDYFRMLAEQRMDAPLPGDWCNIDGVCNGSCRLEPER